MGRGGAGPGAETWRQDAPVAAAMVLAAGVFYLAPWAPVYGPALIAVAVIGWRRLDLALALPVFFAPAFMLPKHVGHEQFAPSEIFIILGVLIAAGWALAPAAGRRLDAARVRHSPFLAPAALFLLAGALSTLAAADQHLALREYREVILEPVVWFGLLLAVQTRASRWVASFAALLGAGLAASVLAVAQLVTGQDLTRVSGSSLPRVKALYGSADNLGLLLDRVVPVWLSVALFARRRAELLLAGIAGALLLVTLFFTFSRGAWFATALAAGALLWRLSWGRRLAVAVLLLAALALAFEARSVALTLRNGHSHTVQQRLYVWQSSLRMIRDHPVFGVGPDNFLTYYAPTRSQDRWQRECAPGKGYMVAAAGDEPCLSHPHNVVLDFWLSTGVLGLTSFLWLQAVFWRESVRAYRRLGGVMQLLLAGAMAAMLASLAHGLVDNSYFLEDLAIFFWLLCGFVSFASAETGPRSAPAGAG
ncbi:MAG TPA: O-antigen ligase family protein [Chloroflexota bacterium]|nr:O-antigen ligase family protein [Chloroflexota bacterium]